MGPHAGTFAGASASAAAGAGATPRQVMHRSPLEQPMPYALSRHDVEHYEVHQAYTAKNDNLLPLPQNLVSFLGVLSAHKPAVQRLLEQHGLNMHTQTPECGFTAHHARTAGSTGPGPARRLYDQQATLVLPMVLGCEGEYGCPNITTIVGQCRQMKVMLDAVAEVRAAADPAAARRQLIIETDARAEVTPVSDSAWLDRHVPRSLASELGRTSLSRCCRAPWRTPSLGRARCRAAWPSCCSHRRAARHRGSSTPKPARPRHAPSTCARSTR